MQKTESHRLPAIRFLFLFILSLIGFGGFVLLFLVPQRAGGVWESILRFPSKLHSLFRFCDDWNILLITFLFCLCIIIFCLNDLLLKKYLPNKSNGFYSAGFTWMLRNTLSLIMFFFECGILCFIITHSVSTPLIYSNADDIPSKKYKVLLLGTSKLVKGTVKVNAYYKNRIDAVEQLYKKHLVSGIVVSGDRHGTYDETRDMKNDLLKIGIPGSVISLDAQGYRTFDSVIRLGEEEINSRGEEVIIVSQFFHLERAIFMARESGLKSIGFAAEGNMTLGMIQREFLAKPRVLLDIYLFNTQVSGVAAHPRRSITLSRAGDVIILLFVIPLLVGSGRLTRKLLEF